MKVKLGFFYDAWKVLADWIKGESSDKPKVEVDGTVEVSNLPDTQQVAGTVQVTNLPEVQQVTASEPLPVQNDEIEEALVQIQSKIDDLEEALERIKFDTADISNDVATMQAEFGDLHQKLYDEPMPVSINGNIQEFAVASWDDLPPDSVPVGSIAILIGTDDIRQTDGKEWIPL